MQTPQKTIDESVVTEKNAVLGGTLYLVATPIGNLSDLSERAIKVLSEVDFVAAEDTRNSGLLLSRLGISKPFVSYFEHNKRERGEVIASRLENGESCALITDAGTPAISDPGEDIVRLCADRGIPVSSIPGACAAITALTLSALPTRRFVFEGFLSGNKAERKERLTALSHEDRTMILYEAPHHLRQTLADLVKYLGEDRPITLCRELTKRNEEIHRTTLAQAIAYYTEKEPRGEYVLVIGGGVAEAQEESYPSDIGEHVAQLEESGLTRMEAIKACAKARGVSKNEIYTVVNRKVEETE